MNDIEIQTSYVRVPNQDSQIDAYLARPTKEGKLAAVIVFHEIFGVNGNIREITELIARQGSIAIAPAMYQRLAPGFTLDYRIFRYDAGHGFFGGFFADKYPFLKRHPSYNCEAAPHAWQQVLELFNVISR
jgi:dienelactone hydrolase